MHALSKQEWAWEFLRRNEEYRSDYLAFDQQRGFLEAKFGPICDWCEVDLSDQVELWHFDPPRKPAESEHMWRIRAICSGAEPTKALLHKGMARRWQLQTMVDPQSDCGLHVAFRSQGEPSIWFRPEDIDATALAEEEVPTAVYVRLDAAKSISRQLRSVRRRLIVRQRALKKEGLKWRTSLYPDRWPQYLRILDEFAVGKTAKQIAKAEFPDVPDEYPEYAAHARVRAMHDQALALVRGGYRWILSAED